MIQQFTSEELNTVKRAVRNQNARSNQNISRVNEYVVDNPTISVPCCFQEFRITKSWMQHIHTKNLYMLTKLG